MKQLKCVYAHRNCFLNRFFMLRRTGRVTLFHIVAASLTRIIILRTNRLRTLAPYAWPIKLTSHQSELQSNLLFWSTKWDSLSEPHTHAQWDGGISSWEGRMGSGPSVVSGVSLVKHTLQMVQVYNYAERWFPLCVCVYYRRNSCRSV